MLDDERRMRMSLAQTISQFCHVALLLIFVSSALQKLRDHHAFERSVEGFALLPSAWISPVAWLVTVAEIGVVMFLLAGVLSSVALLIGLLFSTVLLLVFTSALISVVMRGLNVACGCFGADDRPV